MPSVPPPSASPPPPTAAADGAAAPVPEPRVDDLPPWQLWTAPAAILGGFAIGLVGTIVVGIVAAASGGSLTHPSPGVSLLEDLVFDLSFVTAAIYFAALRRATPADFGFRLIPWKLGLGAFALAGVSYYIVTAIYASLVHLHGSDKLPSELGVSKSTLALVGAAVFVCVIAPICEEFFFRGFVFGALRHWKINFAGRDLGTVFAAIVTGILFGLAHTGSASSQYLVPLGFLGFVLCVVRWKTRSLYPCMALHSVNNSLALGINQLHWNALEIFGLIASSLVLIASITVPLAQRTPMRTGVTNMSA
jgi:membrane protease YdiL (CAAX protease family)